MPNKQSPLLEMKEIHKAFGANRVLKGVGFSLKAGEIRALLGENGAGKSTLMNILGGVLPADKGEIFLKGQSRQFTEPAQSQAAGIAFIHQELNLINDLTVVDNMFLGREITRRGGILDRKAMRAETERVFQTMGITLNPLTMVRDLDTSYKQIVEICKAVLSQAALVIMDEPTTALTEPEIRRVFTIMQTLRAQGTGLVFISHKLNEVMAICDSYSILRDGVVVAEGQVKETTPEQLAYHMVGHAVGVGQAVQQEQQGEEILRLENLSHPTAFRDISLSVHAGEILGVTGLLGDGRRELFETVFGARPLEEGAIYIKGERVSIKNTQTALKMGVGYVPRDRKENGILKDLSILDNATIVTWPALARWGVINKEKQQAALAAQKDSLRIRMENDTDSINSLSGGNQQKVVLAKWLSAQPQVLILDNPTQGVDVGAKEEIYEIIGELARQGMAIVVLSSEAQEIVRLASRALVLFEGNLRGELCGDSLNEHTIMVLATGGKLEDGVLIKCE